jgi:hypothetical protein
VLGGNLVASGAWHSALAKRFFQPLADPLNLRPRAVCVGELAEPQFLCPPVPAAQCVWRAQHGDTAAREHD